MSKDEPTTSFQDKTDCQETTFDLELDGQSQLHIGDKIFHTTGHVFNAPVTIEQHYHVAAPEAPSPEKPENFLQKCERLKKLLKERVQEIASEESSLAEFSQRPITPVNLSIVSKPQRIDDEFQADGHYHRRKDFAKVYERGNSDITPEEMFARSEESAQLEASRKFKPTQVKAKRDYVEKHGNVVGVVGQAGIGKTTSTKKWALQALAGRLFGNVSFFFYIVIRFINFEEKMTFLQFLLSAMFIDYAEFPDEGDQLVRAISSCSDTLLIFDGLDEATFRSFSGKVQPPLLHVKSRPEIYIKHLAGGTLLPRSRKVFTSRPAQLYNLHPSHRPRFILEILGLTAKSQDELGRQICGRGYEPISEKLAENSNLYAYCYVPVNFILTVNYLMSYDGDIQFATLTRVLAYTCGQYSVTEHCKGDERKLDKLAKMAWQGFVNKKVVFNSTDFKNAHIDECTADAFLNTSITKKGNLKLTILEGHKRRYFSHLIWQEFFAAFYLMMIMDLPDFLKHHAKLTKDRWEVVNKFAFGMCDRAVFDDLEAIVPGCSNEEWSEKVSLLGNVIRSFSENQSSDRIKRLCSLAHEANDAAICRCVASLLPNSLDLSDSSLLPTDVENLSSVLMKRRNMMKKLNLSYNAIGDFGACSVGRCIHVIDKLDLGVCSLKDSGLQYLSAKIAALSRPIMVLDLHGNKLTDLSAKYLAECVHNIKILSVYGCRFTESAKDLVRSKSTGEVYFDFPLSLYKTVP